jgi:hypothetical protein
VSSCARSRVLDRPDVRSEKQVAHCTTQQIGDPPLRQVMRTIVDQMAALAQTAQVAQPVVGRIMIEVRGSQYDTRCP